MGRLDQVGMVGSGGKGWIRWMTMGTCIKIWRGTMYMAYMQPGALR